MLFFNYELVNYILLSEKKNTFNTNSDIGMISNNNDNDNIDDKIEMMWLAVTSSRAADAGSFCHTNLIHTWWRVFIV